MLLVLLVAFETMWAMQVGCGLALAAGAGCVVLVWCWCGAGVVQVVLVPGLGLRQAWLRCCGAAVLRCCVQRRMHALAAAVVHGPG